MKTMLTIQQTKRLFDLGVPKEKASCTTLTHYEEGQPCLFPIFNLTDLLEILPNEISYNHDDCFLMMIRDVYRVYSVGYAFQTFEGCDFCYNCEFLGELIDSLYQLVCWYYEEYLKK